MISMFSQGRFSSMGPIKMFLKFSTHIVNKMYYDVYTQQFSRNTFL